MFFGKKNLAVVVVVLVIILIVVLGRFRMKLKCGGHSTMAREPQGVCVCVCVVVEAAKPATGPTGAHPTATRVCASVRATMGSEKKERGGREEAGEKVMGRGGEGRLKQDENKCMCVCVCVCVDLGRDSLRSCD